MPDSHNNNSNNSKLFLELIACSKCGNAFMRKPDEADNTVCENCVKLDERKRELEIGVFNNLIEVNCIDGIWQYLIFHLLYVIS